LRFEILNLKLQILLRPGNFSQKFPVFFFQLQQSGYAVGTGFGKRKKHQSQSEKNNEKWIATEE